MLTLEGKIDVVLFIFSGVFNQNWLFSDGVAVWSHFVPIFKKRSKFHFLRLLSCLLSASLGLRMHFKASLCVWEQLAKGS